MVDPVLFIQLEQYELLLPGGKMKLQFACLEHSKASGGIFYLLELRTHNVIPVIWRDKLKMMDSIVIYDSLYSSE